MAILNQKRILNLIPKVSVPVTIHVSQGDVGTQIEFTLVKGDEVFVNPGNVTASVHGVREDGANFGPFTCTLSGSKVTFPLHSEMTAVKGSALAEIVLVDNGGNKVGSANFGILVEESAFPLGVTYDNDVSVYESILAYVQTSVAQLTNDYTSKINAVQSGLNNEISARTNEDALINTRIDEIIAPSGEAPSAAEVTDARVGADGVTYGSLGTAVRTQIGNLKTEMNESLAPRIDKKYISSGGSLSGASGYEVVSPIHLRKGETIYFYTDTNTSGDFTALAEISSDDISSATITPKIKTHSLNMNGRYYTYTAENDVIVALSSAKTIHFFISTNKNIVNNILRNAGADPSLATQNGWCNGTYVTRAYSDGVYTLTATEHRANSCLNLVLANEQIDYDHVYYFYAEVKTSESKECAIGLGDTKSQKFKIGSDGWTQVYFYGKFTTEKTVHVYVNSRDGNAVGDIYKVRKPILIDVTESFNDFPTTDPNEDFSGVTILDDNQYIKNDGTIASGTGLFISDAIHLNSGDSLFINVFERRSSSGWTLLASCDSSVSPESVSPIIKTSGLKNRYCYIAEESGYVCISGFKNAIMYSVNQSLPSTYNTKLARICYNWQNILKTFDCYGYFSDKDNRKYVIAGSNSRYKGFADLVCPGMHDQLAINRVLDYIDCDEIEFTEDSIFNVSAPIRPNSYQTFNCNGALVRMVNLISDEVIAIDSSNQYLTMNTSSGKFVEGMLVYCGDDSTQYNEIIEVLPYQRLVRIGIPTNYGSGFELKNASSAFFIYEKESVKIDNVKIDLNVSNNPRLSKNPWYLQEGIQIAYCKRVWVTHSDIRNGGRRGICTTDSNYVYILNNYFNNWHEHSIDIWTSEMPATNPPETSCVISGNICEDNQMSGIQCHRGSGVSIANNVIRNCPHGGIRNQEFSHHNSIIGNVIYNCDIAGLLIGGHDITASGNTIEDCTNGISIAHMSDYVTVSANTIKNSGNSAIKLEHARHCTIENNTSINSGTVTSGRGVVRIDDDDYEVAPVYSNYADSYNNVFIGNHFAEKTPANAQYLFVDLGTGGNVFTQNVCMFNGTMPNKFTMAKASDITSGNTIVEDSMSFPMD